MSKYASADDIIIFLAMQNYFYVIPSRKSNAFFGIFSGDSYFEKQSIHLMRNGSLAWVLGGIEVIPGYDINTGKNMFKYLYDKSASVLMDLK